MRKILLFITIAWSIALYSQDTFSIVAVDSVTGEIGSAGASCLDDSQFPGSGGAIIISDILPGRGAIHTQAYYREGNQLNARARMEEGMSPAEIIDWLIENDVQNYPSYRQYGIVDFDSSGSPRAAAFTGENCDDYKDHIVGPNYAIQGNILLGPEILDSMESRFLNTEGMLAEKLMAALQGANVVGADTRCTDEGVSSLSAFVRVAQADDTTGVFFLDLNVPTTPYGVEPIDSLQVLFDQWLIWLNTEERRTENADIRIGPNPSDGYIFIFGKDAKEGLFVTIRDLYGTLWHESRLGYSSGKGIDISALSAGAYVITVHDGEGPVAIRKLLRF